MSTVSLSGGSPEWFASHNALNGQWTDDSPDAVAARKKAALKAELEDKIRGAIISNNVQRATELVQEASIVGIHVSPDLLFAVQKMQSDSNRSALEAHAEKVGKTNDARPDSQKAWTADQSQSGEGSSIGAMTALMRGTASPAGVGSTVFGTSNRSTPSAFSLMA